MKSHGGPSNDLLRLAVLCVLVFSLCGAAIGQSPKAVAVHRLALVGGKIYPSPDAPPIVDGVVLIEGGKVAAVGKRGAVAVPRDAQTIDCSGKTIVAGFWNSHVHLTEPKWNNASEQPAAQLTARFQEMLTGYGFTSVVDTGSDPANTIALRKRVESGEIDGPRILTAGAPLYPKNGIPYYLLDTLPPDVLKLLAQPATPEEAVQVVDNDVAQGTDIIKLFVVSWVTRNGRHVPFPMQPEIVKAAAAEAHRKGKLVFAHPSTIEGVQLVLDGHVDVLAHTTEDPENWTPEIVERLKAAKVSLVPTLTLFEGDEMRGNPNILKEAKSYSDAGGQILFGTDIGYLTDYQALTKEFELLGRAGLTFPQILASLTTAPASRFGLSATTGRVAKGLDADLVVLEGDPAQDLKAFSRVKVTVRGGKVIWRTQ